MRILVCPTAFKESLSASAAAAALTAGILEARPGAEIRVLPLSDGGPGLLEAIEAAGDGREERVPTTGPFGDPIAARILWTRPGEVIVEAAEACGLHLVPPAIRDPLRADTSGVGIVLARCGNSGARHIVLGLGGSATVDGGTGMARALGWQFLDVADRPLPPGGEALADLNMILSPEHVSADTSPALFAPDVVALADVYSPLLGPDGAARRFAAQKGAGPDEIELLEYGLTRLADIAARDLGRDVRFIPGAGAAGGLGAGCLLFLGAELLPGADWVLERVGFESELASADLLVTGEGAWDATSGLGKITTEVLARAAEAGVPSILVCGRIEGAVPDGVQALSGADGDWLDADSISALIAHQLGGDD
ncbi:MAG: glycerate kinase [Gemmatimonadetes bacterium]|nr:glycerate kinase [Gemmatimonadota bacterium]